MSWHTLNASGPSELMCKGKLAPVDPTILFIVTHLSFFMCVRLPCMAGPLALYVPCCRILVGHCLYLHCNVGGWPFCPPLIRWLLSPLAFTCNMTRCLVAWIGFVMQLAELIALICNTMWLVGPIAMIGWLYCLNSKCSWLVQLRYLVGALPYLTLC